MNKEKIKQVLKKVIIALDMDDKFGDDIDTRHDAEADAYQEVLSLLAELD
jgi:hypothetical protein